MDLKDLGGISLEEIEEFSNLTANDEREFLSWCNSVFNNPWFSRLIKRLIYDQKTRTFDEATTQEQLQFGRALALGIDFVSKAFRQYSVEFDSKYGQKKPEFDRNKMINRV